MFGWKMLRVILFLATLHACTPLISGKRVPGVVAPASDGRCVQYTGTVCEGFVETVLEFPNLDPISSIEGEISEIMVLVDAFGSDSCRYYARIMACRNFFYPCTEYNVDGMTYSLPNLICRDSCRDVWNGCTSFWESVLGQAGISDLLPNCETDRLGVPNGVVEALSPYPDGLQGAFFFPEESSTWTSPQGTKLELECSHFNASNDADVLLVNCEGPFTVPYTSTDGRNMCSLICPHPMWTIEEYRTMFYLHVIPGLLGGLGCMVLLWDSINVWWVKTPQNRVLRRSVLMRYQWLGSILGVAYMLIGPLPMSFADLTCFESIPHALDTTLAIKETILCTLNRSCPFIVMTLFFLVLMNITDSKIRMQAAILNHKRETPTGWLQIVSLLLPFTLCMIMYSMDDPQMGEAAAQANIARWSLQCGPRLEPEVERLLIHYPFFAIGVIIFAQAFHAGYIARRLQLSLGDTQGPVTKKKTTPSSKDNQNRLMNGMSHITKTLTILGVLCFALSFMSAMVISDITPKLQRTSQQFLDFLICLPTFRSMSTTGEEQISDVIDNFVRPATASNCTSLMEHIGGIKLVNATQVSELDMEDRPSGVTMAFSFMSQSMVVLLYAGFYLSFVSKRRLRRVRRRFDRNVSNSSRMYGHSKIAPSTTSHATDGTMSEVTSADACSQGDTTVPT